MSEPQHPPCCVVHSSSLVDSMSAVRVHCQRQEQRNLQNISPHHGVRCPHRYPGQIQKFEIRNGIEDTGLYAHAAGGQNTADPCGCGSGNCHIDHHWHDTEYYCHRKGCRCISEPRGQKQSKAYCGQNGKQAGQDEEPL